MTDSVNSEEILKIIEGIAQGIEMNIDYLTTLDQAIGDGDHGINLGNGFKAVLNRLDTLKGKDAGEILKSVGRLLISNVGGAVGPLYGIAFIKAGEVVGGKNEVDLSDIVKMFKAAEEGIVNLGKASLGDKTMLDAIHPAVLAIKEAENQNRSLIEALEMSVKAAEEGAKRTIDMVSKLGRSSYLGARSRGHPDVGATSTYIILKSAWETLRKLRSDKK